MYAVGLAFNDSYPLQGLLCTESQLVAGSNPLLVSCKASALPTLSFDVFNAALYGPNSPDFATRDVLYSNGPATNPISTRNSDVMCLVEVDQVRRSAGHHRGGEGRQLQVQLHHLRQPLDALQQRRRRAGRRRVPDEPQPACASVPAAVVQTAFTCMEQHCSSNGAKGSLNQTTDCLSANCVSRSEPSMLEYTAWTACSPT